MLGQYIPKNFCREFAELGVTQIPLIMATVKGLKPLTDVWVEKSRYKEFEKVCRKYGLLYQPNVVFIKPTEEQVKNAIDNYTLTTTKTLGIPFNHKTKEGSVHVFISKSKESIYNANRFGWYPIIINGRVINKPFMDHLRFGEALGYPDCCIDFFKEYNKAGVSTPYETYKLTKEKFSYYCNNVLNFVSLSYIHHYTCSFNCKKTIKLAKKIEKVILEEEPEIVQRIRLESTRPFIVFGERNAYAFDGAAKNGVISYKDVMFVGMTEHNKYETVFKQGNKVIVKEDNIEVLSDERTVRIIQKPKPEDGFLLTFEH